MNEVGEIEASSAAFANWVEEEAHAYVQEWAVGSVDEIEHELNGLSSPESRAARWKTITQLSAVRRPLELDLQNHNTCKAAAADGQLGTRIKLSGSGSQRPREADVLWFPKKLKMKKKNSKLQSKQPKVIHCLERWDIGKGLLRMTIKSEGAIFPRGTWLDKNRWRNLRVKLVQNQVSYLNGRTAPAHVRQYIPVEILRKVAEYLDPLGDVLFNPAYYVDLAFNKRSADMEQLMQKVCRRCIAEAKEGKSFLKGTLSTRTKTNSETTVISIGLGSTYLPPERRRDEDSSSSSDYDVPNPDIEMECFPRWETSTTDIVFNSDEWKKIAQKEEADVRETFARPTAVCLQLVWARMHAFVKEKGMSLFVTKKEAEARLWNMRW
ncbi:unnamed protein product [Amoebophrya sp. A120]|nr:unnamed protein product [Amoebophrya sp. A120]|eukprot:GSA120T00012643001.1